MAAYRTITIICDCCKETIINDQFKNKVEARQVARSKKLLTNKRIRNGSIWDYCSDCAELPIDKGARYDSL